MFTFSSGGTTVTCAAGTHGYNAITRVCDPMDDDANSHGTHVAGTIGGVGNNGIGVAGVNWTTKIVPCKFINASTGTGLTSDAILCLQFMSVVKNNLRANVRVTSNSYGCAGCFSQAFLDQINATDALFVAAAGNSASNNDTAPFYPASYASSKVVSVGASDESDNLASFSNYGSSVQLAAPGTNIWSSMRNNTYGYLSGTSMATPHVSGSAAMLVGNCHTSLTDTRNFLLSYVDPAAGLAGKVSTNGRLNVNRALRACYLPGAGKGSVQVSGTEGRVIDECFTPQNCVYTYDVGTVSITVGSMTKSVNYGRNSTDVSVATALTNAFNGDGTAPVFVRLEGTTLYFFSKMTGSTTCYSISAASNTSNPDTFYGPSFEAWTSGPTLTGCY